MLPFAATIATEQPNVPSPGPLRTVTITLQAELPVCGERTEQQAATILTGPPAALYLWAHDLPKAVHTDLFDAWAFAGGGSAMCDDPQPGASRQATARMSPSCRTGRILTPSPHGG